jgi:hypothetical protein
VLALAPNISPWGWGFRSSGGQSHCRLARSRFNEPIEPKTLGNMRAIGVRSLDVSCWQQDDGACDRARQHTGPRLDDFCRDLRSKVRKHLIHHDDADAKPLGKSSRGQEAAKPRIAGFLLPAHQYS